MNKHTTGNQYSVECPWECGHVITNLWEQLGELEDGDFIQCPWCDCSIEILEIRKVAEITLVANRGES